MSKNRKQPIFRADKVIIHADEVIVIEARDKRRFDRDEDAAEAMDRRKRHEDAAEEMDRRNKHHDDVLGAEDRNRKRFFPW